MIVTESELRQQLRQPHQGARVSVPAGAVLSPSAKDFVAQWRLELVDGGPPEAASPGTPRWDTPSTFSVDDAAAPVCISCGGRVGHKPDHLTQLNTRHLAPKGHPRIRLRGRLDSLQATLLLAASRARTEAAPTTAAHLDQLAAYVRELLAAEYQERPAAPPEVGGLDEAALHAATHDPRGSLGVDHLTPASTDPDTLLWCNLARTACREAELAALDAFPTPHDAAGRSVVHGLNRLSSAVYWVALAHTAAHPLAGEVPT